MFKFNFGLLGADIGIDLGTANVLVHVAGKGIVLNEPSVVAIDNESKQIIAVGAEARSMLGRTPGNIVAVRPLREGVIADYDVTEKMLKYFINKALGKTFFRKPRVMICIPSGVTGVEERAVRQAALQAGARKAYLIEEPLAAALGAGMDIAEPDGSMVVDIGGGTTDVAIISLGGIVCSKSLRTGGDKFDEYIVRYIRREYNLMIGERTAEDIKIKIGTAYADAIEENGMMEVRGRDLVTGLPKTVVISAKETAEALAEPVDAIVSSVKEVLEKTPPEISADIVHRGVVMTGGGALLTNLDRLLAKETELDVRIAEDSLSCVAKGTGQALDHLDILSSTGSFTQKRL